MTTHPSIVLFVGAFIVALARRGTRKPTLVITSLAALACWAFLDADSRWTVSFGDVSLALLRVDPLSLVFGLVFTLVTLVGITYALENDRNGEHASTLAYAGASIGVVFAGDWASLFVFWEIMAIASLFLIWERRTERSARAGYRYLLVHILGGSFLFSGILIHLGRGGDLRVTALTQGSVDPLAFWLILIGVAVNAAIPPLHAWLTDAYPEASVTGSVFLSAFTTKTAVYVLIRVFPGAETLVWAGVVMALYGVVYAIIENDIRRLLAYHIVSQVGYMVAGVGMGTQLSLDGATAHAFSHILYKALLFMGAGAVLYATGLRKLTELGGIGWRMKLVVVLYLIAAFSISGVPLFNGFISKSMVVSAAALDHRPGVELLLTLAGVGTFLSVGLKLPYFTFFGPKRDIDVRPIPWNMTVAMAAGAILCTVYGIMPSLLYRLLPFGSEYHPYTIDHVVSSLQLLLGTGLAFWLLLDKLGGQATISVDTDWLYRRPLAAAFEGVIRGVRSGGEIWTAASRRVIERLWRFSQEPTSSLVAGTDPDAEDYDPYRFRAPIGVTVFWIVVYFFVVVAAALWSL